MAANVYGAIVYKYYTKYASGTSDLGRQYNARQI